MITNLQRWVYKQENLYRQKRNCYRIVSFYFKILFLPRELSDENGTSSIIMVCSQIMAFSLA